jgi:hypothetical protein
MLRSVLALITFAAVASTASAQSLGTFRWQTQPYCNVLTLSVSQQGGVYTLDGFDDQCGAATRATVSGTAARNADGTLQVGLTVVTAPGGRPVHITVSLDTTTLAGTWTDDGGNTGSFAFGASAGGHPRPIPSSVPLSINFAPDSSIVARGTEAPGPTPPISRSTRLVWDAGRGAFRAGGIFYGTEDDDIGQFSVAFGLGARATGVSSFAVASGTASGANSIALGCCGATADGAVAIGSFAGAIGRYSLALGRASAYGQYSVAVGSDAYADHAGALVFGDASGLAARSTANNQFIARAGGGVRFYTNALLTTGVTLAANGSAWASLSDANSKEHFRDLDGGDILAKIAAMPIREWNYKAQAASIRHVGPTAQAFHAAFGLGEDPLRISTIDADGIALRAIQALEERTRTERDDLRRETAELRRENDDLKVALAAVQARLDALDLKRD